MRPLTAPPPAPPTPHEQDSSQIAPTQTSRQATLTSGKSLRSVQTAPHDPNEIAVFATCTPAAGLLNPSFAGEQLATPHSDS